MIKPAPAAKPGPALKGIGPAQPPVDPFVHWDNYYKKATNETPGRLFDTVAELLNVKSFNQSEAAIKGYLRYHGKDAEPWMYEVLVKTIEVRKGPPEEIKTALGFAASLAKRNRRPDDLIRIADMLVIRGYYDQVGMPGYQTNIGELVDMAAEKVPANAYPPMMSINLALKTRDPKRMANSAEQLLALGWPGLDDQMRRDVGEQVNVLSKALKEDGKEEEASTLLARHADSVARDVYAKLTWEGEADLDLVVEEPLGAKAEFKNPRTVFGGAIIKNGYGKHPEEVYVCPRGFDGDYTFKVDPIFVDQAKPVTEARLEIILHEGAADEKRQAHRVELARPEPIVVHLTGGRRKNVLPFLAVEERVVKVDKPRAKPGVPKQPNPAPAPPAAKPAGAPLPIR